VSRNMPSLGCSIIKWMLLLTQLFVQTLAIEKIDSCFPYV